MINYKDDLCAIVGWLVLFYPNVLKEFDERTNIITNLQKEIVGEKK